MENQKLIDIRNSLTMLPVLQLRLSKLEQRIKEAEAEMQVILKQYNSEALDVEQMKKESLSNSLLKLIKKYEGKLDRETQEMLAAKMEYDKAAGRVIDLNNERYDLNGRIAELLACKHSYEAELKQREEMIQNSITSKQYLVYKKLEEQREELGQQLVEIDEAMKVAAYAESTVTSAKEHLESAEGWATYDIWARGGILSHIAKYDHIDNAQEDFNRLSYQLKDLKKELEDIKSFDITSNLGIDSTTRMFDFWFDNIFTDLNVRDKIRADKEEVNKLHFKIQDIIAKLEGNRMEIHKSLRAIEDKKDDLLINNN
ncbi:MAG: hypothetical protein K0Q99_1508 [Clostridia bacterium]|jgi:hypothetical protein|nr:hypothetical protein [Clostridia bacterium]